MLLEAGRHEVSMTDTRITISRTIVKLHDMLSAFAMSTLRHLGSVRGL